MNDPHHLQRFVDAQEGVFEQACAELRSGHKSGHWMWFVFPQLGGLGRSETAIRFGIASLEEAQAYLKHPLLGPRLHECTRLVTLIEGRSIAQIFGYPDDLKFHSCMSLFHCAALEERIFGQALQKFFAGKPDSQTLTLLGR
jgi:uncharacterized protein (DUF1810 family)